MIFVSLLIFLSLLISVTADYISNVTNTDDEFYTQVGATNTGDLNGGVAVLPNNTNSTRTGTDLGGGIVTSTVVDYYADLSLDIRDIAEQIDYKNYDEALRLYLEGRNAESQPGIKLSIHDLNKALALKDAKDSTPLFIYHLWGLSGRDLSKINDNSRYAADTAEYAISSTPLYATNVMIALHMWMYASHVLYNGIHQCQKKSDADYPLAITLGGAGVDEFIAVWIGSNQEHGTLNGYGLYTMTQWVGGLFGKNDPEAQVNSNLKLLYIEGAVALSDPNACSKQNPSTAGQLWNIAQRITSQMYIPLMQLLIHSLFIEDKDGVHFYSIALIPQISQCKPSLFDRLEDALLKVTPDFSRKNEIILDLQAAYDCLGFTCADIGVYKVDQLGECASIPANLPIAEYVPTSYVHDRAKIDLDILQLGILTKVEAFYFATALYQFGRNSPVPRNSYNDPHRVRSLQAFATSTERKAATPFYSEFVAYHNEEDYADTIIMETLKGTGKWGDKSSEQRHEIVIKTAAFQVMYMYALAEMADALTDCNAQDANANAGGAHAWDEVAAYLIGSLEGRGAGGSEDVEDGQLVWNLAKIRAFQFQTISSEGYSEIDSYLLDLLFAGRGELDAYDCENLAKTIDRIQHIVLLPIIQSTLRYAIINAEIPAGDDTATTLAEGEAFALAVLPIIQKYDENAAEVIEENVVVRDGVKPVMDGPQTVANAFYQALDEFGYSCSLVGATTQVDACYEAGGFSKIKGERSPASSSRQQSFIATLTLGVCGLICLMS